MREEIKKRALDILALLIAAGMALGGYHLWVRIQSHNRLDAQLLSVFRQQSDALQLELGQRCEALGWVKPEEETPEEETPAKEE